MSAEMKLRMELINTLTPSFGFEAARAIAIIVDRPLGGDVCRAIGNDGIDALHIALDKLGAE